MSPPRKNAKVKRHGNSSEPREAEAAGWKVGRVSEFLGLTPAEEMLVEMKLALADKLKALRKKKKLTQQQLAQQVGSSQSRIAKIESADESVSLDLMVSMLAALGATRKQIGTIIGIPAATAGYVAADAGGRSTKKAGRVRLTE